MRLDTLKMAAFAAVAAVGLLGSTVGASADWNDRHRGWHDHDRGDRGGRRPDGQGGSWGYDSRYGRVIHCDRFHHWDADHCNRNLGDSGDNGGPANWTPERWHRGEWRHAHDYREPDGQGGSWGYDPRYGGVIRCDRFHHWDANHCNRNL